MGRFVRSDTRQRRRILIFLVCLLVVSFLIRGPNILLLRQLAASLFLLSFFGMLVVFGAWLRVRRPRR